MSVSVVTLLFHNFMMSWSTDVAEDAADSETESTSLLIKFLQVTSQCNTTCSNYVFLFCSNRFSLVQSGFMGMFLLIAHINMR